LAKTALLETLACFDHTGGSDSSGASALSERNNGQQTTLNHVAREARVSVSTAARVLRDSTYPVAPELQKRVRDAAEKLRYVPNLLAKKLRGGEHPSLGLIVGNMRDPHFGQIAQTVTNAARECSLMAMVANMQRDPQQELAMIRELWEHRVNGIILAGGGFDQQTYKGELAALVKQLTRSGVIVVSLGERGIGMPVFSVDNESVALLLARRAVELGHTEIGISTGPSNSHVTPQRLRGFKKIFSAAGIRSTIVHTPFGIPGGVEAQEKLLAANPKITMIIANADTLGVGIVQGLSARGIRVPDDISVMSAGNTIYAEICTPRLVTADVCLAQCCDAAVQYIHGAITGGHPIVPEPPVSKLIDGESVRALAARRIRAV
jgi:LacI family transcriptional regulator